MPIAPSVILETLGFRSQDSECSKSDRRNQDPSQTEQVRDLCGNGDQVPSAPNAVSVPPRTNGMSRPTSGAGVDSLSQPAGRPGPVGKTFAVLAQGRDTPLAFVFAEDEQAAEAYRDEYYKSRPTWLEPWHENLPEPTNPFLRKLLFRDIRPKASVSAR